MLIIYTSAIILFLSIFTNLPFKYLNINKFEKPIFSIGIIILLLNYFYFNFGLSLNFIFFLICILFIPSLIYTIIYFNKFKKKLFKLFYISLPILLLFELIYSFYGQQFYVFRGNQQDTFVYTSVGLSFFNYTHNELVNFRNNISEIFNKYYLTHALNLIYYRPSVSLIIGLLNHIAILELFFISFIFKILCTILVLFSFISFFDYFKLNKNENIFLSLIFILSFFYFYNFEIDAYSLILSLPFFILIMKYSINIEKILTSLNLDLIKYIFLWSCFFIIYPNGAAIVMPPIFFLVIYVLFRNNFRINLIKNIFFSLILFGVITLPTYQTTLLYLYQEMIVGLYHGPDYWGYFGAFIFGKDNPIRDLAVVSQIKSIIAQNYSIFNVFKEILILNYEKNSNLFFFNIIPSLFGYFHLTTNKLSNINLFLIFILFILNILILKKILSNLFYLIFKKDNFSLIIKFFLIYFSIFFLLLIVYDNIWSSIKLFFVLTPIFYFLLIFDFSKENSKPSISFLVILLIFLPFYKYSSFNHGIGKIDSFPSIIHLSNKQNTNWHINREKLYECDSLVYNLENRSEKIFVSMIFNRNKKTKNKKNKCIISKYKKKFKIETI